MYKYIGIAVCVILVSTGVVCAKTVSSKTATSKTTSTSRSKTKGSADTISISDVPSEVETVTVTQVKTKVETVFVAKDNTPVVQNTPKTEKVVRATGVFKIQFGAFKINENADKLYNELKTKYGSNVYKENVAPYCKVGIGGYNTESGVKAAQKTFVSQGYGDVFITH